MSQPPLSPFGSPSGRTPDLDVLTVPVRPGITLVEASAGTGKTFALARLVLRLVLDGQVTDLSRLLVVTFTKAATEELKTRIRRALHEARDAFALRTDPTDAPALVAPFLAPYGTSESDRSRSLARLTAALAGADAAAVSTIHGFCQRELARAAFAAGEPFHLDYAEDDKALVARARIDAWHRLTHTDPRVAGLAVREGWAGGTFDEVFQALRRHPRARLAPAPPSLAETLDEAEAAARDLGAALDGSFGAAAAEIGWRPRAPFKGLAPDEIESALQAAAADPFGASAAPVQGGAPARLEEDCYKKAQADAAALAGHPVAQACGRLGRALDLLKHAAARTSAEETERALAAIKRRRGVITPDDLLLRLYEGLQPGPEGDRLAQAIGAHYDAALVDEFQDTDPYQLAIFRRAFADRPVFFVGDPKQAIYGFRGADLFAYLAARKETEEGDQRFALGINWRSTSGVVSAINALFSGPERPFLYGGIPYEPVQPSPTADASRLHEAAHGDAAFVWWTFDAPEDKKAQTKTDLQGRLVYATVHEIRRLLVHGTLEGSHGTRRVRPGDIGVVTRSNREARAVQAALREAGVPSVVGQNDSVLKSAEIGEVERVLAAIARPHDGRAVRGALATELWGWGAAAIAALDTDAAGYTALLGRLHGWQHLWRQRGVLSALEAFLGRERVPARLLRYVDGERRLTNVRHVAALLHRAEGTARRRPEDLLRWLSGRAQRPLAGREEAELRLESDAEAVQIATVHSAKGLEYGVLFAPFLCMGFRPKTDLPTIVHEEGDLVVDLGSDRLGERRRMREAEELAEEVRLVYVALTRAKHRVYAAWGPVSNAEHTGLGYLLHGHTAHQSNGPAGHTALAKQATKGEQGNARSVLQALADACPSMRLAALPSSGAGFAAGPEPVAPPARRGTARALPDEAQDRLAPRARGSFSAWTHHAWEGAEAPAAERAGADERDVVEEESAADLSLSAFAPSGRQGPGEDPDAAEHDPALGGLHHFAAGLEPGLCLHALIEGADLRDPAGEATRRLTERTLALFGLADPAAHRRAPSEEPFDVCSTALALLTRLADLPLPGAPVIEGTPGTLGALTHRQRVPEWRFVLPLGGFDPHALADAFAEHAAPALQPYAAALRTLRADHAEGLLSGTADLVCEWGGRHYLLDWKSNRLGGDDAAYGPDALRAAMRERHYVLQYHLYLVALDAHLRARLPGYRYDDHIGGVGYAFLRGAARSDFGLYTDRPPRALIERLSELLLGKRG